MVAARGLVVVVVVLDEVGRILGQGVDNAASAHVELPEA